MYSSLYSSSSSSPANELASYSSPEVEEEDNCLELIRSSGDGEEEEVFKVEECKCLTLRSSDGEKFKVEAKAALQSGTLNNLLQNVRYSGGLILVPKVTAKALAVAIIYCAEHANANAANANAKAEDDRYQVMIIKKKKLQLEEFDSSLLDKLDQVLLQDLMGAAKVLHIPGLLDTISLRLAAAAATTAAADDDDLKVSSSSTTTREEVKVDRSSWSSRSSEVSRRIKKPFKKLVGFVRSSEVSCSSSTTTHEEVKVDQPSSLSRSYNVSRRKKKPLQKFAGFVRTQSHALSVLNQKKKIMV